jgi:hypothetical protein
MKYATEMGPGKYWFRYLIGGYTRNRQHGDRISLLLFFQNKEGRLTRL